MYNRARRVMFAAIGFAGGMLLWGMWVIVILAGRFDPDHWFPYAMLAGLDSVAIVAAGVAEERWKWRWCGWGVCLAIGVSLAIVLHFLHDYSLWWRG